MEKYNPDRLNRFSFSSTDSERGRRRNKIWIGLGVALVILVLLAGVLAIFLPPLFKKSPPPPPPVPPECPLDDLQRIDCHPDRPVTEKSCLDRGCCYRPASDLNVTDNDLISSRFLGVPSCFFPVDYKGYQHITLGTLSNEAGWYQMISEFKRVTPSGFSKDVKKISVTVTPIDDYQLRIKITDDENDRFEPDVATTFKIKPLRNPLYSVEFDGGLLKITRNSTQQPVFVTDISRLIFSDQFLQLSTEVASKYIYGLGEQKEGILKSTNWARYTLFNQGDLPVPNRNLYGSHPFYLVVEPDGQANGVFLLNSNAIDYVLQPTPAVTIRPVGGIFDFYIFLGPTPGEVVSQYTALFGRPNFPPRWSMGFHICKYGYFSLNNTKEVLKRNLDAGVTIDVQWHDIDYMDRHLDFTYDHKNFSGLPDFVDDLHNDGRYYVAMISPGVSNTEEPSTYKAYDDAKRLDLFIKDTKGKDIEGKVWNDNFTVFPDFSNPRTPGYWKQQFESFYSILKFDGVWIDMNEPLNFLNGSSESCPPSEHDDPPYLPGRPYPLNTLTLCMSAQHNKTVHYNEHNLLAYREAKATHATMKSITNKRPFIISRASFAGQGEFSGHWSGDITSDWQDLRYTIPAMLAFSLYGMPMTGSDICGFRLNTTEELCARWQSLGAFYPFSRNHNDFDTVEQDPAAMGDTVTSSTINALKIRYQLLPYLYTLFYRNHIFGETVARPLFFEFPKDNETYAIEDQFLWGPALLIMPALDPGVKIVNPYIPEGIWYDLAGHSHTSHGEHFRLEANLTDINIAVRGGYILPTQEPGKTLNETAHNPFGLLVALDGEKKAKGELYWDDGESLDTYDSKKYSLVQMSVEKNTLNVKPIQKNFDTMPPLSSITVYGVDAEPTYVTVNGKVTGSENVNYTADNHVLQINVAKDSLYDLAVTWN